MNENKKLGKEFNLNLDEHFEIKYGCVNRLDPKVIYINCKCWISPNTMHEIDKTMNDILLKFKIKLKDIINNSDYFYNKFIYDYFLSLNNLKRNKKNFFSIEFLLHRKDTELDFYDLKKQIELSFKHLFNELSNDILKTNIFNVTKTKRSR